MLGMGVDGYAESLFGTLHKVASTTAMNVHFDAARHNGATLRINDFGTLNVQVVVANGFDFVTFNNYRTALEPTLWGENAAINDLLKHDRIKV